MDEDSAAASRRSDTDGFSLHEELPSDHPDRFIQMMHIIIRFCVKCLAGLMVLVIVLGVIDVAHVMYLSLWHSDDLVLDVHDIFNVFGAFMVVLIAVEIFVNIRMYLGSNTIPVKLVIATALMAIARKVIILDLSKVGSDYVFAIAAVVLALGVAYWMVPMAHNVRSR